MVDSSGQPSQSIMYLGEAVLIIIYGLDPHYPCSSSSSTYMASTHHLIYLLPLLPLLAVAGGGGGCPAGDASSLLAFKHALSDPDGHLVSWSAAVDCCSWSHVSCDATGVAGLDLAGLGLSSSDKDAFAPLAGLTNLVSLDLSNNDFGILPIPAGIFPHIPRLTHLNLSMSGFNGSVPPDLGKARMLVSLDLSSNYWLTVEDGRLLADLHELEELYLDRVNLSMAFPWKSCRALSSGSPKLRVVSLSYCSIVNCSLETLLNNLTSITHLGLDGNDFSSSPIPAFLSDFRTLSVLSLAGCDLEGEFPAGIFQLKWLKILDVSSNLGLSGKLLEFPKGSALEKLALSHTNFTGELPASVGNLAHLALLGLSYARFSGALPENIGKMVRLTRLHLSNNNFVGRIPSLAQLKRLVDLDLSSNGFQGCFQGNLANNFDINGNNSLPGTIDLSDNRVQGEFPRSIFQLSQLEVLKLSSNNFSGIVQLDLFAGMPHLSRLELSHCGLSVHIENDSHSNFQQFLVLKLASCNLTRIPEFLQKQTSLAELDLSANRISGDIPNWIRKSESLWFLNLSSNLLTGLQDNLSSKYLRVLDLSGNSFHSALPLDIGTNLYSASFVSLSHNYLIGSIPSSICKVYVDVLDLSENNLNGSIPSCLPQKMIDLEVLNLHENSISGAIPDAFSKGCSLEIFNLYGNKIVGQIPTSLKNCRQLVVLNLGNNGIEGTFPSWLGELPHLQILVLRSNRLQGRVQPFFGGFEQLQIMDLSSNSFSGNLCSSCFNSWKSMIATENKPSHDQVIEFEISNLYLNNIPPYYRDTLTLTIKGSELKLEKILTALVAIDLSNNNFEGFIPETIGNLRLLHLLNLSHNALTSTIPRSVGNLSQLESLDLSWNKLTGEIPQEIVHLTFLSVLNLSSNQLEGKIPHGGQLDTFSASSYRDNAGLCGLPLSNSCGHDGESHHPTTSKGHQLTNWKWIVSEIGFVIGFGVIWLPLVFCRRWWILYFTYVDSFLWRIPFLDRFLLS